MGGGFGKGLWLGLAHGGILSFITKGREFWNLRKTTSDSYKTKLAVDHEKIEYPKSDGKLTFDLLENLQRSGTYHDHDQPSHLKIKEGKMHANQKSLKEF